MISMTARQEMRALEALENVPGSVRTAGLNIVACARLKRPAAHADLDVILAYTARQQRVNRWGQ